MLLNKKYGLHFKKNRAVEVNEGSKAKDISIQRTNGWESSNVDKAILYGFDPSELLFFNKKKKEKFLSLHLIGKDIFGFTQFIACANVKQV